MALKIHHVSILCCLILNQGSANSTTYLHIHTTMYDICKNSWLLFPFGLSFLSDVAHFWQATIYLGGLHIFDGIIVCVRLSARRERESILWLKISWSHVHTHRVAAPGRNQRGAWPCRSVEMMARGEGKDPSFLWSTRVWWWW